MSPDQFDALMDLIDHKIATALRFGKFSSNTLSAKQGRVRQMLTRPKTNPCQLPGLFRKPKRKATWKTICAGCSSTRATSSRPTTSATRTAGCARSTRKSRRCVPK